MYIYILYFCIKCVSTFLESKSDIIYIIFDVQCSEDRDIFIMGSGTVKRHLLKIKFERSTQHTHKHDHVSNIITHARMYTFSKKWHKFFILYTLNLIRCPGARPLFDIFLLVPTSQLRGVACKQRMLPILVLALAGP